MDSLRLEKAYRHWGHDLTDEDTLLEAGLSFTAAWDKLGGFIGMEALLAQKAHGLERRLLLFQLNDSTAHLFHDEPIWREDHIVGSITSAAYGHTVGAAIGFGYVECVRGETLRSLCGHRYEVEVGHRRIPAIASPRALWDPQGTEIHC